MKSRKRLKLFKMLCLGISLNSLTAMASCQKVPPFEGDLYLGHSETREAVGAINSISCNQPEFDTLVCMPAEDFAAEIRLRFQCKEWKLGTKLIDPEGFMDPFDAFLKEEQ